MKAPATSLPGSRDWCRGLAVLMLALISVGAWADQGDNPGLRLLERIGEQTPQLHYHGILVYRHGGDMETLRIIHRGGAEHERSERFYTLTGIPREVIRKPDEVICILPDAEAVVVGRRQLRNPIAQALPRYTEALQEAYEVTLAGEGRVADRDAQQVLIVPRDDLRYGHRLWIDEAYGLLLRADLLDEHQQVLEQVMFTEVTVVEAVPDAWLEPGISGESFTWVRPADRADAAPEQRRWQVAEVPPGFRLISHRQRQIAGHDPPVEHLHYSDGLASVSVYVSPQAADKVRERAARMGLMGAVRVPRDGFTVTVVGEVPRATLHLFAERLAATGDEGARP
ncbi:MucB/RseB C-terminal domain-containing protein [Alkalilimnicola ehrlichii MLHE-1]|uniref:Sigma E regulatory protein, MucB/RseB n=1 Tax=Alkalilimnicola ehrlichii (strain ATCC BAA-1101 / DSM 17681 / MLHE-1) TaxID=187272 RepID=Q0A8Z7_ALKEH|nr:MucB/RseB C-terminal domain-containing protein [Alkalilimnicola ehrlichii]ABI56690.1 sigma E regulatory protein, MucB/RseB [Alkalilimnicola ehrlichii MLHE-1]